MGIPDCIWNLKPLKNANRRCISRAYVEGRLKCVLQEIAVALYREIVFPFYIRLEVYPSLRDFNENTLTHVYRAYCNFIAYHERRIAARQYILRKSLIEIVR